MSPFNPGLVHTPVTPFKRDHTIDFDALEKLIEFHLKSGADAIALPMPQGEDMSLVEEEKRGLLEAAVKQIDGRVPVLAHVSDAGTDIAIARARHAESLGVAAIVSHPPYFWHAKPDMIVEHIVRVGAAVKLPFYLCSLPVESAGTPLSTDVTLKVAQRSPNMAGLVDACMDWVFMAEVMSNVPRIRPGFQLLPGTDYMVPPAVIGATGAFSPLSAIAPKLVRKVYDLCAKQQFTQARTAQEEIATLSHLLKTSGFPGLKGALRAMGRDCGPTRPPVRDLTAEQQEKLTRALRAMPFLEAEAKGW